MGRLTFNSGFPIEVTEISPSLIACACRALGSRVKPRVRLVMQFGPNHELGGVLRGAWDQVLSLKVLPGHRKRRLLLK